MKYFPYEMHPQTSPTLRIFKNFHTQNIFWSIIFSPSFIHKGITWSYYIINIYKRCRIKRETRYHVYSKCTSITVKPILCSCIQITPMWLVNFHSNFNNTKRNKFRSITKCLLSASELLFWVWRFEVVLNKIF